MARPRHISFHDIIGGLHTSSRKSFLVPFQQVRLYEILVTLLVVERLDSTKPCGTKCISLTAGTSFSPPNKGVQKEGLVERLKGTVKWFNNAKGYGFIARDDGGIDLFVHITSCVDGLEKLPEGARVKFEERPSRHKPGSFEARDVLLV